MTAKSARQTAEGGEFLEKDVVYAKVLKLEFLEEFLVHVQGRQRREEYLEMKPEI